MIAAAKIKTHSPPPHSCAFGANGFVFSLAAFSPSGATTTGAENPHPGFAASETEHRLAQTVANFRNALEINAEVRQNGVGLNCNGEEITSTSNDRTKFGTYVRDSYTGLDYADQRFYASTYGRFNTPDPARNSAVLRIPSSWNRYAYVYGDPVNRRDPSGMTSCDANGDNCYDSVDVTEDGGGSGGSGGGRDRQLPDQGNGSICSWELPNCAGVGSTTQNGISPGSPDYEQARAALAGEAAGLTTQFQSAQSPECEHDLAAVGVTDAQVSGAAGSANIINGLTSMTNYAQAIYGNSPAAGAAASLYGSEIMAQYMSLNVGVAAVSQAPGSNIYINAAWVNGMTTGQQTAMLLHELLHGITGMTDDSIQGALGLSTKAPSQNIGDKLQADCFK
jgi:RHS repeat-associated protein